MSFSFVYRTVYSQLLYPITLQQQILSFQYPSSLLIPYLSHLSLVISMPAIVIYLFDLITNLIISTNFMNHPYPVTSKITSTIIQIGSKLSSLVMRIHDFLYKTNMLWLLMLFCEHRLLLHFLSYVCRILISTFFHPYE